MLKRSIYEKLSSFLPLRAKKEDPTAGNFFYLLSGYHVKMFYFIFIFMFYFIFRAQNFGKRWGLTVSRKYNILIISRALSIPTFFQNLGCESLFYFFIFLLFILFIFVHFYLFFYIIFIYFLLFF